MRRKNFFPSKPTYLVHILIDIELVTGPSLGGGRVVCWGAAVVGCGLFLRPPLCLFLALHLLPLHFVFLLLHFLPSFRRHLGLLAFGFFLFGAFVGFGATIIGWSCIRFTRSMVVTLRLNWHSSFSVRGVLYLVSTWSEIREWLHGEFSARAKFPPAQPYWNCFTITRQLSAWVELKFKYEPVWNLSSGLNNGVWEWNNVSLYFIILKLICI